MGGVQPVNAVQYLGDSHFFSCYSAVQKNQQLKNLIYFKLLYSIAFWNLQYFQLNSDSLTRKNTLKSIICQPQTSKPETNSLYYEAQHKFWGDCWGEFCQAWTRCSWTLAVCPRGMRKSPKTRLCINEHRHEIQNELMEVYALAIQHIWSTSTYKGKKKHNSGCSMSTLTIT